MAGIADLLFTGGENERRRQAILNARDTGYQKGGIAAGTGLALRTTAKELAGGVIDAADAGMGAVAGAIDPLAQGLKTFVTGDPTPIGRGSAAPALAAPVQPALAAPAAVPDAGPVTKVVSAGLPTQAAPDLSTPQATGIAVPVAPSPIDRLPGYFSSSSTLGGLLANNVALNGINMMNNRQQQLFNNTVKATQAAAVEEQTRSNRLDNQNRQAIADLSTALLAEKDPAQRREMGNNLLLLKGKDPRENAFKVAQYEDALDPANPLAGTKKVPVIIDANGNARFVSPQGGGASKPTLDQFMAEFKKDPRAKSFTDADIKAYYTKEYGAAK